MGRQSKNNLDRLEGIKTVFVPNLVINAIKDFIRYRFGSYKEYQFSNHQGEGIKAFHNK